VPDNYTFATGRRKTSVARVMVKSGSGAISVNGKPLDEYFPTKIQVLQVQQPLDITDNLNKWDFRVTVSGGGFSGQAGAVRHGIARAVAQVDPDSKQPLSNRGYLTRDSRMVERKKAGQPKARKKFQFSKR
jgi:small subunit ribosomal protein S9